MILEAEGDIFIIKCRFNDNYLLEQLDCRWSKAKKHWRVYNSRVNRNILKTIKFQFISEDAWALLTMPDMDPELKVSMIQHTKPLPFQTPATEKLLSLKYCALFAPVGSGKSKIAVDVIQSLYYAGKIDRVLIIGLVSIIENWKQELSKHWLGNSPPMEIFMITGIESYSAGKMADKAEKWVTERTVVLVDESSKIKNQAAIRTEKVTDIASKAGYRYIMTGSSILNGNIDLYAQFNFLHPDICGITTLVGFRKRYCIYGGYENKKIIGYKRQEELIGNLSPYSFVITKEEAMPHLPTQTFSPRRVQATVEQKRLIEKIKSELKTEVTNDKGEKVDKRIQNVLTKIMRISQVAGGFLEDGSRIKGTNPKVQALKDIMEDSPDEQMVIFVRFVPELLELGREIKNSTIIYGDIERVERQNRVDAFQRGEHQYIISQYAVGALGLNMDAARLCCQYSYDFNLEYWVQCIGRIARTTQKRPMTYFPLILEGSADAMMYRALQSKEGVSKAVTRALMSGNAEELFS